MSNDLNSCSFIGRLGKDPETRYTTSGEAVCSFSIAVGSQWKDKAGEKQESTEWVNVSAFGKLAEICSTYLKKGSQIYIGGRMKTEKYQAKDGSDRYSTKIIADRMQMLGSKADHSEEAATPAPEAKKEPATNIAGFEGFDEDIPFS